MAVKKLATLLVTMGILAAGCGQGTETAATDDTPPSSLAAASNDTTPEEDDEQENQVILTPSTTEAPQPSSTTTAANGGVAYDIGPAAGEVMDVVGVRYDDVLNVRDQPGISGNVVATVAPFAANPQIVSNGAGELFGANAAWWNVTVNGTDAWANVNFVGMVSPNSEDLFPQLQSGLMSTTANDLATLIKNIGNALASGPTPSVVLSTEPVALDAIGSEATIDVINIGDDSLKGWRIEIQFDNVFDDINGANPQIVGVTLVSATGFPICARGQDGSGLCL